MKNTIPNRRPEVGQEGFTLVELMIAVAMMAVVAPMIVTLFTKITQGFGADEARYQLKKVNEEALDRIYMRVGSNKTLYDTADFGTTLVTKLDLTGCPATLAGGQLPTINPTGTLNTDSASFDGTKFGNCLALLSMENKVTLRGVTNVANLPVTVELDQYRVYYYYQTADNPHSLSKVAATRLIEWTSAPLVDFQAVSQIVATDATLGGNIISRLANPASMTYPNKPVSFYIDTSAPVTGTFLYKKNGTTYTAAVSADKIPKDFTGTDDRGAVKNPTVGWTALTHMSGGLLSRGMRYGIAPNSTVLYTPVLQVPMFATANGTFPGAFEVGIVGAAAGRQVLIRSGLLAQGAMQGFVGSHRVMIASCKDLY